MKYIIINYAIVAGVTFPSEPMDFGEMLPIYKGMHKNARRGLCDFPTVIDESGRKVHIVIGKYKTDKNFTTVYSHKVIYTIAKNGDWGCVAVGNRTAMGFMITDEDYKKWSFECEKTGTFVLYED